MKCRPWTNCTASSSKTLRSGKQDEDAICDTPSSKIPTQGTITQPTPFPKTPVVTMGLDSSPTVVPTNPGFVWILITFVLLLTVAGALVLLFSYRRMKKRKLDILCNGIYAIPCKESKSIHPPDLLRTQMDQEDTFSCQFPEEKRGEKVLRENFSLGISGPLKAQASWQMSVGAQVSQLTSLERKSLLQIQVMDENKRLAFKLCSRLTPLSVVKLEKFSVDILAP